jgi:hypothetical protein
MIDEYTTELCDVADAEGRMRVKHGTQCRITVESGGKVLQDYLTGIETMNAAITVAGIMYNRLSMTNGVDWWDPSTGRSIERPHVLRRLRLSDLLTGDQTCDCEECAACRS